MIRTLKIFIVGITALVAGACIKQDNAFCPAGVTVSCEFLYYGDGQTDIFRDKITSVTAFVFDNNETLISKTDLNAETLGKYPGLRIELDEGEYTLVFWGNVGENTEISDIGGMNNLSDFMVTHPGLSLGSGVSNFDEIYFATSALRVDRYGDGNAQAIFDCAHVHLDVYIEDWYSNSENTVPPYLEVVNVHSQYGMRMQLHGRSINMYSTPVPDASGMFHVSMLRTFRFSDDNELALKIYNDKKDPIAEISLSDFIKKYELSIENVQEAELSIRVKFNKGGVSLSVDPWDDNDVKPIF